jgi:hypothetical protein
MTGGGHAGISLAGRWECGGCGASGDGWWDEDNGLVIQDIDGRTILHECGETDA